jgi:hypothetical protein
MHGNNENSHFISSRHNIPIMGNTLMIKNVIGIFILVGMLFPAEVSASATPKLLVASYLNDAVYALRLLNTMARREFLIAFSSRTFHIRIIPVQVLYLGLTAIFIPAVFLLEELVMAC